MSFPWSYSILGLVPGLILTVVIAGIVLYTSLITWYDILPKGCKPVMGFNVKVSLGDSVCDTRKSATFAISASICSGTPRLRGGPQQSCSS